MKRVVFGLLVLLIVPAVFGQQSRTISNEEAAALVYRFVADTRELDGSDPDALVSFLGAEPDALVSIPPQGMGRLPGQSGELIGYYVGGPSAVSYRVVRLSVEPGVEPVRVGRAHVARIDGRAVELSPWQVPDRPQRILIDGDSLDWDQVEATLTFGSLFRPLRIEHATTGEPLSLAEAQFWGTGGTRLFDLRARRAPGMLFVAVQSYEDFTDGATIHLTAFTDRNANAIGEVVAIIAGPGGPVVWRGASGGVELVGNYARRGRFLEIEADIGAIRTALGGRASGEVSFDVATSIGIGERIEQFTLASFNPGIDLRR